MSIGGDGGERVFLCVVFVVGRCRCCGFGELCKRRRFPTGAELTAATAERCWPGASAAARRPGAAVQRRDRVHHLVVGRRVYEDGLQRGLLLLLLP